MKATSVAISIISLAAPCSAFVTPHPRSIHRTTTATITTSASRITTLQAMEIPDMNMDLETMQQIITSSSHLLADAASTAAAEVQVQTEKDAGWWENYLNLYKTLLLFVHSTISTATSSDQTWGISIAAFTASKLLFLLNIIENHSLFIIVCW
jgi:hypothetical protein